jgi:hypothetical protein
MLSKVYGWTPQQVRDIDEGDVQAYLDIISIRNKHESNEIKKINKR